MLRHGQRLPLDAGATRALHDKIKPLAPMKFVGSVGAAGRQPPELRSWNLTPRSLRKIRVGDFHNVRGPPREVIAL